MIRWQLYDRTRSISIWDTTTHDGLVYCSTIKLDVCGQNGFVYCSTIKLDVCGQNGYVYCSTIKLDVCGQNGYTIDASSAQRPKLSIRDLLGFLILEYGKVDSSSTTGLPQYILRSMLEGSEAELVQWIIFSLLLFYKLSLITSKTFASHFIIIYICAILHLGRNTSDLHLGCNMSSAIIATCNLQSRESYKSVS